MNARHENAGSVVDTKRMQDRVHEVLFGLRPANADACPTRVSQATPEGSLMAERRSSSMGRVLPGEETLHGWQADLREWKLKHLHGGLGPGKYLGRRVTAGPLLDAARLDVVKGSERTGGELPGLAIDVPQNSGSISARF